jgi:hypothetical protein
MRLTYTDIMGRADTVNIPHGMSEITAEWLTTKGVRVETVASLVVPPGMRVTGMRDEVEISYQAANERAGEYFAEEAGGGASKGDLLERKPPKVPAFEIEQPAGASSQLVGVEPTSGKAKHEAGCMFKYTDDTGEHGIELPLGMRTITSDWLDTKLNRVTLTSVVIPEGVTSIERYAFRDCSALESVVIPEGVTSIERYAFEGCTALESVVIPDSVMSIGLDAFSGCTALESVVIPEGVTRIRGYAFWGCTALESVVIPGSVTSIGEFVFYGCSALQSVVIPEGVTSIEGYVFSRCSALESVVIPEGVTRIGVWAFNDCTALESVVIPDSVTSIEWGAFGDCRGLRYILAPVGLDLGWAGVPDTTQVIRYDPAIKQLPLAARVVAARGLYSQIVGELELDAAEDKLKLQDQLKSLFFPISRMLTPALKQLALLSRVKVLTEEGELMTGQLLQTVYQHIAGNHKVMCKGGRGKAYSGQVRQSLISLLDGLSKKVGTERDPLTRAMSFVGPELGLLMRGERFDFQMEGIMEKANVGGGATKQV